MEGQKRRLQANRQQPQRSTGIRERRRDAAMPGIPSYRAVRWHGRAAFLHQGRLCRSDEVATAGVVITQNGASGSTLIYRLIDTVSRDARSD